MSTAINDVQGGIIRRDGKLTPIAGTDASAADTHPPEDQAPRSVPLAMTRGRQISAARTG